MRKSFRFHEALIFSFSLNFSLKHSSATVPTNLFHLGLVRQIWAVTSGFLQTLFLFIAPPLSQTSSKPILPTPCTLLNVQVSCWEGSVFHSSPARCPSHSFSYHVLWLELPRGTGLGICTAYSSVLQLWNQSEWPCCPHAASMLSSSTLTFCRQVLGDWIVKYLAFCEVQLLLCCSQTPLCTSIAICTTLGASWKSQNLNTEASRVLFRAAPFRCHPEIGTAPAAYPYFKENLWVKTLSSVSDWNTVWQ